MNPIGMGLREGGRWAPSVYKFAYQKERMRKMKKKWTGLLAILLACALTACGGEKEPKPSQGAENDPPASSQQSEQQSEQPSAGENHSIIYICLNLGDLSFNDMGWDGCRAAAEKYGWTAEVLELGKDTSTYENAFLDSIDSGDYDIVVTQSNYGLSDLCIKYAPEYPDISFVSYDMSASAEISGDNLYGIAFKQNEGSFLVGALAGKLTTSNKIGVFIFNDVPVGNDFLTGYIAGVRHSNPDAEVSVAYGGGTADASKLQEVSSAMFDSGVDVIYGVSGSAYPGLAREATNRGGFDKGIYAIGVDSDMWTVYTASENAGIADVIITSMQKKVDEAVVYAMDQYVEGTLPFGSVQAYGILENGVGMADNEHYRSCTPEDVLSYMEQLQEDVISGTVTVPSYFDFESYDEFAAWRDQ